MPFTPLHLGPGIAIKTIMQRQFSLMVFGWSQIVIDSQPLYVMLTNKGTLHGFSHTYIGTTLLGLLCAVSGKYLGAFGLKILRESEHLPISRQVLRRAGQRQAGGRGAGRGAGGIVFRSQTRRTPTR